MIAATWVYATGATVTFVAALALIAVARRRGVFAIENWRAVALAAWVAMIWPWAWRSLS